MKKVFICSPFRGDEATKQRNIDAAVFACSVAIGRGYAPIAPHLFIPRCLDDSSERERALGLKVSKALLEACSEVWQWGDIITAGMAAELIYAVQRGKRIRKFNIFGAEEK